MPPLEGVEVIVPGIIKPGEVGVPGPTVMVVLFPPKLRGPVIIAGTRGPKFMGTTMVGVLPVRLIGPGRVVPVPIVRAGIVGPVFVRVKVPVPVTVPPGITLRLPIVSGNVPTLRVPVLPTVTLLVGPI
jgi:hypothetical protein